MFGTLYIFLMCFDPSRQQLIKTLMFLDIRLLKNTTVQRKTKVKTLNFYRGLNFEQKCRRLALPGRAWFCPAILATGCRPEPPTLTRRSQDDGSPRPTDKLPQISI